jgi:hypothetical protein
MAMSAGEHYFFMSDVPLAVADDGEHALPVSDCPLNIVQCGEGTPYRACRKVNATHFDKYHVDFGPTAATTVPFAIR